MSKFGFTTNSVLTEKEIEILLRDDAKTLGLRSPWPQPKCSTLVRNARSIRS